MDPNASGSNPRMDPYQNTLLWYSNLKKLNQQKQKSFCYLDQIQTTQ